MDRSTTRRKRGWLLALAWTLAAACGRGEAPVSVRIVEPEDGAVVPGPDVRVVLEAEGVEITDATVDRPGTAHHHLFVNRDLTPLEDTIPAGVTGILHLGRGQTEFVLTGLAAGEHRVIALLADKDHIPLGPPAADTIRFTVLAGPDEESDAEDESGPEEEPGPDPEGDPAPR